MSRSQNLMEPLRYVTAPYQDFAPRPPSRPVEWIEPAVASRAGPGPGPVDLIGLTLDHSPVAGSLRAAATALHEAPHLAYALPLILEDTMTLMAAEFANVQIVDPRDGSLVLVAQSGFGPGFLEDFAVVRDDHSVCGQAAGSGAQAVVADVRAEPALEPHWGTFRAAGVRAVQSTPLVDEQGKLIGMISTHSPWPREPSERDLQVMRLYSHFAGEAFARLLPRSLPT
ncbi:hypothetical protein DN069_33425 [Streptacidiphilus pinicola]|uniref:GAF domain-containing protein n=1 Tax=Streptacidiphilus pinicola TaxID=2219663 RepID=A0A2X0I9Z9_9ACTN|nr:GAF domain-containing protein [Streptacidiphilus pinicola]RAG81327.1 hypothetical protein DN069_33425 [Streptacidiphilus pinicola]